MPFYERKEDKDADFNTTHHTLAFYPSSLSFCARKVLAMGKKENKFQADLIKEIKKEFPGCIVLKADANHIQGIPDLLILHKEKWASLECKKDEKSDRQPNQEYYVNTMDAMSYSSFIYPKNKEEVLNELKVHFQ